MKTMFMKIAAVMGAVACSATGAVAARPASSAPVPAFLWSGSAYSQGGQANVAQTVSLSEFGDAFQSMAAGQPVAKTNALSNYVTAGAQAPEAVVAFVYDRLSAQDVASGSFSSLQNLLETHSSLSMPYMATNGQRVSTTLTNVLKSASQDSHVVAERLSTCSALKSLIERQAEQNAFNNGVTDLLVVDCKQKYGHADSCLESATEMLEQATGGRYVALVTSDSPSAHVQMAFNSAAAQEELELQAAEAIIYTGPRLITSTILFALLLGGFLLILLYTGVASLMSIEPPVRFTTVKLQIAKEYN